MTENFMSMEKTMEQLYVDRDDTGDITFLVESQRIQAHRMVLAAQSPRYKAQFYGAYGDSREIFIPNVSAAAFNVFLQFFYKKTVALTMDNIEMVLDLAQQSLVDEYIESCAAFLRASLTPHNFFEFYDLAVLYNIKSLRVVCEKRISTYTINLFDSDDFLECDRDVLLQILKMHTLNCSEADVFRACLAWARSQCGKPSAVFGKPANLRAALGDIIYQIRFSSFDAEEFVALHRSMPGFFTADEVVEILRIIDKSDDFKPQKFNDSQFERSKAYGWIPEGLLQCKRYSWKKLSSVKSRRIYQTRYLDFHCSCNKPIRLHGISLDFHFEDDILDGFPRTITTAIRHNENGPLILFESKYKIYRNPKKSGETVIMFHEPIDQIIYFSCSLQLSHLHLVYGPELRHSVESHGRKFSMCGGVVSRIYFDVTAEHAHGLQDFGPFVRSTKMNKIPIYNWSPVFIKEPVPEFYHSLVLNQIQTYGMFLIPR